MIICNINLTLAECKEGEQYDAIKEQCFLCETGTYKESIGNTDKCKSCPTDKTTAGPGAKQASDCSESEFFVPICKS
jgi:hypothetical protein